MNLSSIATADLLLELGTRCEKAERILSVLGETGSKPTAKKRKHRLTPDMIKKAIGSKPSTVSKNAVRAHLTRLGATTSGKRPNMLYTLGASE